MLFRDISYYLDQAKQQNRLKSDSALDRALGYKGSMVSFLRKGKTLPSPEKIIEIADLAGINEETALMDLGVWSTRGKAQEVYSNILQKLASFALIFCSLGAFTVASTSPAQATEQSGTCAYKHIPLYSLSHIIIENISKRPVKPALYDL